jgi:chromate transporter
VVTQVDKRASKISNRARKMRTRVRNTRREIERIANTPTLGGLFLSFLKIGTVGFGGLAVIAQIRTLAVQQRRWLTEQDFASGFALAQTLPGTSAGNTVTYVGLRVRGWRGAAAAIAGFILPSMLMMIVLAILYRHLRDLPDIDRLFHGFSAAVVALIIVTAWRMGRNTLIKRWQWVLAVSSCVVVAFFSATVIEVVLAAGLIGIFIDSYAEKQLRKLGQLEGVASRRKRIAARMTLERRRRRTRETHFVGGYLMRAMAEERVRRAALAELAAAETREADNLAKDDPVQDDSRDPSQPASKKFGSATLFGVSLPILAKVALLLTLSTIFLRIGSITFGGGFVMIPLIEAEVVDLHHWLTHQEFVDATALGQITPGPVLITATFIGYRVAGTLGALVATVSIFLPSFVMTVVAGSSLARFHTNRIVQSFLKGVTPAVVGLLVAAGISIGRAGIHSWVGLLIAIIAGAILVRYRPNAIWVILGAGLVRFVIGFFVA